MNLKKWFVFLLISILLLPIFTSSAKSAENPEFRYELTVDGKETVEVNSGDIITVTLYLYRTDENVPYTMYAMQDEIRYDSDFFQFVQDSTVLSDGIQSTDIRVAEDLREFYMNYLSLSGGAKWEAKTRIGSFQLKVIAESGVTMITNEDFLVSLPDGSGSYKCEANVLNVILSTECTVKFETNGGSPIDPVTVIYGELLERPEDPVREGKVLVGWFRDIHLKEEWNFETDIVEGNMTLYAKWADSVQETEQDIGREDEQTVPEIEGEQCSICGRTDMIISGLSLCWICLLLIVLLLILVIDIVYSIWRRKQGRNKKGKSEE